MIADSAETTFCAATLLGVGLNAWAGWWQADPIAGLVIAALAVKEGLKPSKTTTETPPPSRPCNGVAIRSQRGGWARAGAGLCRRPRTTGLSGEPSVLNLAHLHGSDAFHGRRLA